MVIEVSKYTKIYHRLQSNSFLLFPLFLFKNLFLHHGFLGGRVFLRQNEKLFLRGGLRYQRRKNLRHESNNIINLKKKNFFFSLQFFFVCVWGG